VTLKIQFKSSYVTKMMLTI